MADVNRILKIEFLSQLREIVSIGVHVIAVPSLRGATVTSPVVCDDAITVLTEEQHLRVPVVRR